MFPLLRSAVWMAANLFLEVGVEESPLKSMAPLTYNGKPPLLLSDATCWSSLENRSKTATSAIGMHGASMATYGRLQTGA
ncbi:hypothetical protein FKM82_001415 [Ascaphus truei]